MRTYRSYAAALQANGGNVVYCKGRGLWIDTGDLCLAPRLDQAEFWPRLGGKASPQFKRILALISLDNNRDIVVSIEAATAVVLHCDRPVAATRFFAALLANYRADEKRWAHAA